MPPTDTGADDPSRSLARDLEAGDAMSPCEEDAAADSSKDCIPSGRWHGHFVRRTLLMERREDMSIGLAIRGAFVHGVGVGADGWFSLEGCYDPPSRNIQLIKQYVKGLTVLYHGYYDGTQIKGYWELPNTLSQNTGSFVLLPGDVDVHDTPSPANHSERHRLRRPCSRCGLALAIVPEVELTCPGCGAVLNTVALIYGGSCLWSASVTHPRVGVFHRALGAAGTVLRGKPRPKNRSDGKHPLRVPCQGCGYNLMGLPSRHRCPECGLKYDHASRWLFADSRPQIVLWCSPKTFLVFATLPSLAGIVIGLYGIRTGQPHLFMSTINMCLVSLGLLVVGFPLCSAILTYSRNASDRGGHKHHRHFVIADGSGIVVAGPGATRTRIPWQMIARAEYEPTQNRLTILDAHGEILLTHKFAWSNSVSRIRLQACALEISRLAYLRRMQSQASSMHAGGEPLD